MSFSLLKTLRSLLLCTMCTNVYTHPPSPVVTTIQPEMEQSRISTSKDTIKDLCLIYLVMTVCRSGRMSSKIFMICGSKPISSIRSASSRTFWQQAEQVKKIKTQSNNHVHGVGTNGADQVCDGEKIDELIHLKVIQPSRRCNHDVHATFYQVNLTSPVPPTIDADAGRS